MKELLRTAGLCLLGITASAADPSITPDIQFSVNANKDFVFSSGVWTATSGVEVPLDLTKTNISKLHCEHKEMNCWESLSWINSNKLEGALIVYTVTSWTATEIKAVKPFPCQTIELTFVVGSTEVIRIMRNGGLMPTDQCTAYPRLPNPNMMKLMSPQDAAKTMKN